MANLYSSYWNANLKKATYVKMKKKTGFEVNFIIFLQAAFVQVDKRWSVWHTALSIECKSWV